jgi:inositol polyphosphate 5-phosphatase INPP5B/F
MALLCWTFDAWLRRREAEFTVVQPFRTFVCTWNVNGKVPTESFDPWLTGGMRGWDVLPDLWVVGLQEMVDLSATSVALSTLSDQSAKRAADWQEALLRSLHAAVPPPGTPGGRPVGEGIVPIASEAMVGLAIFVFAKTTLAKSITSAATSHVATGVLGMLGNKGCVAARLSVQDTSFCFINAHLAAHRSAVTARNNDFHSIMNRLEFFRDDEAASSASPLVSESAALSRSASLGKEGPSTSGSGVGVAAHDIVVFFGDLNYRLNDAISTEDAMQLSKRGNIDKLLPFDQLNAQRKGGAAFSEFSEAQISFPPTYKFRAGTSLYDDRSEKKKMRAPGWCDRVLWSTRKRQEGSVKALYYSRVEDMLTSDHKAVHLLLEMDAMQIVPERREHVRVDLMKQLDKLENAAVPRVELSEQIVELGTMVYRAPVTHKVVLSNTGSNPALWRFVPKPHDTTPTPHWLTIEPMFGLLLPGQDCSLTLTATMTTSVARLAARGLQHQLDEIAVLRVEGGADHFLSVTASLKCSAFGCTISQLARMHAPARDHAFSKIGPVLPSSREGTSSASLDDLFGEPTAATPAAAAEPEATPIPPLPVPKEVWILVDRILHGGDGQGLSAPGLFITPAEPSQVTLCRECVDTARAIPPDAASPQAAAQVLLELLAASPEPLIPSNWFPTLARATQVAASSSPELSTESAFAARMLSDLPVLQFNTLMYCLSLWREALLPEQANSNGLTPSLLSVVLTPCLFRPVSESLTPASTVLASIIDVASLEPGLAPGGVAEDVDESSATSTLAGAVTLELLTTPSLRM